MKYSSQLPGMAFDTFYTLYLVNIVIPKESAIEKVEVSKIKHGHKLNSVRFVYCSFWYGLFWLD